MKKVSICIPAYKRTDVLKRALDSIFEQEFTDYEIIITDDSPDDSVQDFIRSYPKESILYFKNAENLGSPENWNEGIRKANGQYVKILHHDDWFSSPKSLGEFIKMLDENPSADIAFSGSCDIHPKLKKVHITPKNIQNKIASEPEFLFKGNQIGAPDVCIFRNNKNYFFDSKLIWLVDIDFYINVLKQNSIFVYNENILVNIGISGMQITQQCLADSLLQIKEAFYLYEKYNLNHKDYSYKKSLIRLLGRTKIFNMRDLNNILPDFNLQLSIKDTFWARYFYAKKQIRRLFTKLTPL